MYRCVSMEIKHSGEPQAPPETAINPKGLVDRKSAQRRRTITFFVVTIINVGLIVLLWTQLLSPAKPATTTTSTGSTDTLGDISSPLIGQPAPNFSLQSVADSQGTK